MKFKMEVNMDNAAFDEMPERELSVILADVIRAFLIEGKTYGNCADRNDNTVGHWGIST